MATLFLQDMHVLYIGLGLIRNWISVAVVLQLTGQKGTVKCNGGISALTLQQPPRG